MNETWVTVSGNVATDVTWRRTATGSVANFYLMSNERKFDGESGTWRDGDRLGLRVSCWRALAENVRMSVTKGDPVVVHGRLYTSDFEQDGVRRSSTRIDAKSVGLDLRTVCTRVVVLQEAGPDDGRGLADVSNLEVVAEGPSAADDEERSSESSEVVGLVDDEPLEREALAS